MNHINTSIEYLKTCVSLCFFWKFNCLPGSDEILESREDDDEADVAHDRTGPQSLEAHEDGCVDPCDSRCNRRILSHRISEFGLVE